jgi:hypothetical protein
MIPLLIATEPFLITDNSCIRCLVLGVVGPASVTSSLAFLIRISTVFMVVSQIVKRRT